MRILLLGEYSNVHASLALGLRERGHEVCVASNGDFWKNYPRDIDLARQEGRLGGLRLLAKILLALPRFRGYDVVQVINPMFLELKAERIAPIFRFLKRQNKKVVLGAYGADYYWVSRSDEKIFRYGDFNIGSSLRHDAEAEAMRADWTAPAKRSLSEMCAREADAIVSGLYEYDAVYRPLFPEKTTFIPYPISAANARVSHEYDGRLRIFCGVSRGRSAYKGTDIMLSAAREVSERFADRVELTVAEGLPFDEYRRRMLSSDVILDQLYSYTPAMNALEAMSHGIIVVGGGEEENYQILGERELRPIVNVLPTRESVVGQLTVLASAPAEEIARLKQQSVDYIRRHHATEIVAERYEALYRELLAQS